jgi:hypothetical protein
LKSVSRRAPTNSLGQPWRGETWRCLVCGESGPDRDDLPHPACAKHPSGRPNAPHLVEYAPADHEAAIQARRSPEERAAIEAWRTIAERRGAA